MAEHEISDSSLPGKDSVGELSTGEPAALEPAALEPAALEPAALEPAALEPSPAVTAESGQPAQDQETKAGSEDGAQAQAALAAKGRASTRTSRAPVSPQKSANSSTSVLPEPPGPYMPNGVRGGRFGTGKPKSDVDWCIYRAGQVPGPGQYGVPRLPAKTGGRFSSANPKSDVEWEMIRASKIPAPGQYEIKEHVPPGGRFSAANPKSDLEWRMLRAAQVRLVGARVRCLRDTSFSDIMALSGSWAGPISRRQARQTAWWSHEHVCYRHGCRLEHEACRQDSRSRRVRFHIRVEFVGREVLHIKTQDRCRVDYAQGQTGPWTWRIQTPIVHTDWRQVWGKQA